MWAELHEEVDRLPASYRDAVVLCYLEGLTNEEAAGRLRWPVGTVKVRLSRARERLRKRLTRRGLAPAVGLLGAAPSSDAAAVSPVLVNLTVRAAMGRGANGVVAATILSLSQEALRTMMLTKLKLGALGMLSVAAVAVGAGGILGQDAKDGPKAAAPAGGKAVADAAPAVDEIADLRRRLLAGSRERYDAQKKEYADEQLTTQQFLDVLEQLATAEQLAAATKADRHDALKAHIGRLSSLLHDKQAKFDKFPGVDYDDIAVIRFRLDAARLRLAEELAAAHGTPADQHRPALSPDQMEGFIVNQAHGTPADQHRPAPRRDAGAEAKSKLPARLRDAYVVEPPDLLIVEVLEALPGRPISGERLVRPDGKISLGFYGDVYVAGLTLPEVKEKVVRQLTKFIDGETLGLKEIADDNGTPDDPDDDKYVPVEPKDSNRVFVDVSAYNSKVYYVQGAVATPGRFPITGNDTVLDAIQYAGGLLPSAAFDKVRLLRPSPPGTRDRDEVMPVNYEEITTGTDRSTNYEIMPGDRLAVPYQKAKSPEPPDRGETDRPAGRSETGAVEQRLDSLEKKLDRLINLLDGKNRERGTGTDFERKPGSPPDRSRKK